MFKIFGKEEKKIPALVVKSKKEEQPLTPDEGVIIHSMPEQFRNLTLKTGSNVKATGLVIVIGGAVVLLSAVVFMYYFLIKSPVQKTAKQPSAETPKQTTQQSAVTETPVVATPAMPTEKPEDAYLRIKRSELSAPGATSSAPAPDDLGNITASVNGNYAVLQAATKDGTKGGVINMSVDSGAWKIESENWITIVMQSATTTPAEATSTATDQTTNYRPGIDTDGDGLTDKEEAIFGTSPTSTDSNSNGYLDGFEVLHLYDPAVKGRKLSASPNFKIFSNKSFGYSFLYPGKWDINDSGGDEAIMIKSPDNQFIQAVSQPNPDRLSIEDWYKKQFSVDTVLPDRIASSTTWDAVFSQDGLIAYLTDKKHDYLFTLAYNPAENQTLDYINIFKVVLSSFEIKN